MAPVNPVKIEDLPPEAQMPVLVREVFAQGDRISELKSVVHKRMDVTDGNVTDLLMWRAKIYGALVMAGALGGVAGAIATKLLGVF